MDYSSYLLRPEPPTTMKNSIFPLFILFPFLAFGQSKVQTTKDSMVELKEQVNQYEQLLADWANLKKYREENKNLPPPLSREKRILFMGNSITESWKNLDSSFFANKSYTNRGISGQTTPQMLI